MHKSLGKGEFGVLHDRMTRSRDLAVFSFHRLTKSQHAFSYAGPKAWNELPRKLHCMKSYGSFKRSLKTYFIEKY